MTEVVTNADRKVWIKIQDFIDVGLVLMATNNADLLDFYFTLLPEGTRITPQDLADFEKISDELCWDSLLIFEKHCTERGMWS